MKAIITPSAQKDISKLAPVIRKRIAETIDQIEKTSKQIKSQQLKSKPLRYKVRVGNWRIILSIDHKADITYILKVEHRKDVYR
ncbi:MAG: type II toxin-antitoxin system RelE/ParE family toxin [Nitrospirae bacterium]|uniref:type II toxin-antitoxin system RelE family toxin n=1 Tax=Candidatus Magnetobacterium casense TaxID=1455061 RepID=UPI00058AF5AE|nr:type II toxin-antitoxin system RelE/ParE family toxin [Nitrospirota bacterium]